MALVLAAALSTAACGDSDDDGPGPDGGGKDDTARVTLTLRPSSAATPEDLAKAREVLAARLDFAGVESGTVRVTGDTLTIEAPAGDREILDGIARTGRLDFRPVLAARAADAPPTPGGPPTVPPGATAQAAEAYAALDCRRNDQADAAATAAASAPDSPAAGCAPGMGSSGTAEALLLGASELTGDDLQSAKAELPPEQATGGWQVHLAFDTDGTAKFGDITGRLARGELPTDRFAVLMDGRVLLAPTVTEQLPDGNAVITGTFTRAEATLHAAQLSSGTLPVPFTVVSTS